MHNVLGFMLTRREAQVIALVAADQSNKEIAFQLALTTGMVNNYVRGAFTKVRVRSARGLAAWGTQHRDALHSAAGMVSSAHGPPRVARMSELRRADEHPPGAVSPKVVRAPRVAAARAGS